MAVYGLPGLIRLMVSMEKAENAVKPPKIPVVKKAATLGQKWVLELQPKTDQ